MNGDDWEDLHENYVEWDRLSVDANEDNNLDKPAVKGANKTTVKAETSSTYNDFHDLG